MRPARWRLVPIALLVGVIALPVTASAAEQGETAGTDAELRIEAADVAAHPLVELTVAVPAGGGEVLTADAFAVAEAGEDREIISVDLAGTADLEVVLLLDVTGSMAGEPLTAAQGAATSFLEQLPADARVALVTYDTQATVVSDFDATREAQQVTIAELQAGGSTAMYDAVATATELFPGDDPDAARTIVLLTDGEDNASARTLDATRDLLVERGVTLHGVAYRTAFSDHDALRTMTDATDGALKAANDAAALTAVYEELASELTSRYTLAYDSAAHGTTVVALSVAVDGARLDTERSFDLPAAPEPAAAPESAVSTVVVEAGVGRTVLYGGLAAWFVALTTIGVIVGLPRLRRSQIAGAAHRARGDHGGLGDLANRATLFADRSLQRHDAGSGLNQALERAGVNLRPGEFLVLAVSLGVTGAILGTLLANVVLGVLLGVLVGLGARAVLNVKATKRQAAFGDQLGDTLQLLSGSLRAGYSLMQAVDSVAREAESPAAEEFNRLVVETRLGRDMNEALHALGERMQSQDFSWVAQAIAINREVGGDLANVLDTVAETIRERNQIRRQVKSLSAEGRMSTYVLIALPFVVSLLLSLVNPGYMSELYAGGVVGWLVIGIALTMITIGALWMRALVKFRF
ncbi:type II secretion system F family protein [Egicoccus halophilus]|uniref:VWFA domain-containing protein n=1 Tax=Egicoccus halophilus TaxID=1670830 RepID=A0A8J3A6X1_9ACTN|nr:type II secretion system F family protein [Egicoccus halophilus]GGI04825.1 hypothetical protein GCM10011354_11030 [Egicoccus halophilus]